MRVSQISRDPDPAVSAAPLIPPAGFDWRWYVRSYTDLAPAGINDEQSAIRHWREYGCKEGRRCAPRRPSPFDWLTYVDHFPDETDAGASRVDGTRLYCPSIDSIFLRAWGDLVCWDDAGSDRVLQPWYPAADYADVFLSGAYDVVRRSAAAGRMAWPDDCTRCLLLRMRPVNDPLRDRRSIRIVRIEPSYLCSLDCPGCVPLAVRRRHTKEFQLDPNILDRIIADLVAGGFAIDALDFQGHGEPLLNPRTWEMSARSRERLPHTWITMTTNAQGRLRPEMVRSGLDEIVCSIDGIDQQTYAMYRVHGNFDLAWTFMCDLVRAARTARRPLRVVWKYVLLDHNASGDTLLKVQRMALETGVSELVFVLTRNGRPPTNIQSPSDVPRLDRGPRLSFRFHQPSIDDLEARVARARELASSERHSEAAALVESVHRNVERFFPADVARPERLLRLLEEITRASGRW